MYILLNLDDADSADVFENKKELMQHIADNFDPADQSEIDNLRVYDISKVDPKMPKLEFKISLL